MKEVCSEGELEVVAQLAVVCLERKPYVALDESERVVKASMF